MSAQCAGTDTFVQYSCRGNADYEHVCVAGVWYRVAKIQPTPATCHHCWLKPFLRLIMTKFSPTGHIGVKCTCLTATLPTCHAHSDTSQDIQSRVTLGSTKTMNTLLSGRYARHRLQHSRTLPVERGPQFWNLHQFLVRHTVLVLPRKQVMS